MLCGLHQNLNLDTFFPLSFLFFFFFFAQVPFGKITLAQIGWTQFGSCNFYRHSWGAELNWGLDFDWAYSGHAPFLALRCGFWCMFQVIVLLKGESSSMSQCSCQLQHDFLQDFAVLSASTIFPSAFKGFTDLAVKKPPQSEMLPSLCLNVVNSFVLKPKTP